MKTFSIKYSMKSIYRRKVRNTYAILGITLGVSLLLGVQVSMASSEEGWKSMFLRSLGDIEAELIPVVEPFVNESMAWNLRTVALEEDIGIEGITGRLQLSATAFNSKAGRIELSIPFEGVPQNETGFGDFIDISGQKINLGLNSSLVGVGYVEFGPANLSFPVLDPLLIGEELADELDIKKGDELLIVYGEGAYYFNISKRVDYIFKQEQRGREHGAMSLITRLEPLQLLVSPLSSSQYNVTNPINRILINFDSSVNSKKKAEASLNDLRALHTEALTGYESGFFFYSNTKFSILDYIKVLSESLNQLLTIFGSLIVLAGLLLIINIQLMSVEERQQQVGVLRAVGTQRSQILLTTILETVLLGVIGSVLGIIGGVVYGWLLIQAMAWAFEYPASEIPLVLNEMTVILSFIIGFVIALLTSIIPAWRASRINITEVIRGISPPEEKKFGKKGLYVGISLIIIGLLWAVYSELEPWGGTSAWSNVDDVDIMYFIVLLPICGIALSASYFFSKRWSLNTLGFVLLGWPVYTGLVVLHWVNEGSGGMFMFIGMTLSLIAGSCLLIGVNLDYLATFIRKTVGIFGPMKAIALVAMEQMASKKVRSTLVFAIFSVVLTMNIMLAIWSQSLRYGTDETIEIESGGADIVIVADQDIPRTLNFSHHVTEEFDDRGVNLVRGFSESINPTPVFSSEKEANDSKFEEATFSPVIPINTKSFWRSNVSNLINLGEDPYDHWIFRFETSSTKISELDTTSNSNSQKEGVKRENEGAWRALAQNKLFDDKPIAIAAVSEGFAEIIGPKPGESIWLLATNGTPIEFTVASTFFDNILVNWRDALQAQTGPATYTTIFVSEEMASNLLAFEDGINEESLFLVEVPNRMSISDKNTNLAASIERWANSEEGEFRQNNELYGIAAIPIWDIFEVTFEGTYRMLTFLQLFTSGGFLVGVLGLLVVSMRSVQERKREIGMMRSLGFRKLDVTFAVLFELVLMGIIGLIVGLLNGGFLAYAFLELMTSGTAAYLIPWEIILIYTTMVLGSAFFAAIIPGWLAARIPPSDALRYAG